MPSAIQATVGSPPVGRAATSTRRASGFRYGAARSTSRGSRRQAVDKCLCPTPSTRVIALTLLCPARRVFTAVSKNPQRSSVVTQARARRGCQRSARERIASHLGLARRTRRVPRIFFLQQIVSLPTLPHDQEIPGQAQRSARFGCKPAALPTELNARSRRPRYCDKAAQNASSSSGVAAATGRRRSA